MEGYEEIPFARSSVCPRVWPDLSFGFKNWGVGVGGVVVVVVVVVGGGGGGGGAGGGGGGGVVVVVVGFRV